MTGAASLSDVRRDNLRRLIDDSGGPNVLAARLGYSNASYLVQMAGPNPTRPVTEKTARKFEMQLNLAPGWLDRTGQQSPPENHGSVGLVKEVVLVAGQRSESLNVRLSAVKFSEVCALLYQEALLTGAADAEFAQRIIMLAS